MTNTVSLEQGMLDGVNAVRNAFNVPTLAKLPPGQPGEAYDCPGHRGLDGFGLGSFLVGTDAIDVDGAFADIIGRTWGTERIPCGDHHEDRGEPCPYAHVALPLTMQHFIKVYDTGSITHLIDQAAVQATAAARTAHEQATIG